MPVALPIVDKIEIRPDSITGPRDIRAVQTLRISVTDRCNFRCAYCMPEDKLDWAPRESLLTFEEIVAVARAALRHGIRCFKITGGEPLVRHELPRLVAMLRELPGADEISMTTNGALLTEHAPALRAAGLHRVTVSMDTLDGDKFREITRGGDLAQVWQGILAAVDAGLGRPKINCVAMRGVNDDEFHQFAALTLTESLTVRFIEYMPLGRTALGGEYQARFISENEIRGRIEARCGRLVPAMRDTGHGPANVWRLPGAVGRIGFISAMSKPFCQTCNRLRLTAEGQLRSCLFDGGEVELRPIVRKALAPSPLKGEGWSENPKTRSHDELHQAFIDCVAFKPDVHSYFGNRQMSQIGG